ncbi:hypothetical protein [Agrobacterium tumefaciens]|uniref:Nitroreductase domain-containing protein n=1 Tax=Agrobacterium tumefaciens TaxID=358 RepID=A0A2L2LHA0_AGRTU|nr:hypothetical protein [Agrobacterium tumefaciens]AVH43724.1 hypothetical protein At1D1609_36710 [Agrobacterium tumefaciens]NSY97664.1 hypothetical protein [Agrobacterium tumefaciens]
MSAGALHPVKAVIISRDGGTFVYDDEADTFFSIEPRNAEGVGAFHEKCATVLPLATGHVIALMADVGHVSTVYSNPESLVWRDSGAVLQTLALVSEAFDLGFCPLGILGQELADALLPMEHQYLGVGVAVIGRRSSG